MPSRALTLLLLGVMAVMPPLAQASPPDQTWISGWYDNADYDDAIVSITSTPASVDTNPLGDLVVVRVAMRPVPTYQPDAPPSLATAPQDSRAPPAV